MPRGISNRKLEYQAVTEIRQQACNFKHAYGCIIGLLDQVHKCLRENESITAKEAEQARAFAASRWPSFKKQTILRRIGSGSKYGRNGTVSCASTMQRKIENGGKREACHQRQNSQGSPQTPLPERGRSITCLTQHLTRMLSTSIFASIERLRKALTLVL